MATTKANHCQWRFSWRSVSWARRPSLQAPLTARQMWLRGDRRRGRVVPPAASKTCDSLGTRGFEPGAAPSGSLEMDSRSARVTRRWGAKRGEAPAMVAPFVNSRGPRCMGFLRPLPGWAGGCASADVIGDCTRHRFYATVGKNCPHGFINARLRLTRCAVPSRCPPALPSRRHSTVSPPGLQLCLAAPEHSLRTET